MPLLGNAAMLLNFDIDAEAIAEHDHWHTFEHLPERLSIPGFARGTRWVSHGTTDANDASPRYMVIYEVADLAVLTSSPYLARLDAPTPWTARMMAHYRGMTRGLCAVLGSCGFGFGGHAGLLRFRPRDADADEVVRHLCDSVLPALPSTPGVVSAHLLRGAARAPMTREQRIRGVDAGIDHAIVVTGHDADAVQVAITALDHDARLAHDVDATRLCRLFSLHHTLSNTELA